jgi:excisionase family DNA binding protein
MATLPLDPTEPVAPTEFEVSLARESARRLARQLTKAKGTRLHVAKPGGGSETITIPTTAFRLLVTILAQMAIGNAVRLIPHHAELTTREAAELLNVSRPYLVRILDLGGIPFRKVGTHRRILFKDIMAYKAKHRRARRAALDELSRLDQEFGLI